MPVPARGTVTIEPLAIAPDDPIRRVPGRGASEQELNRWNQALRAHPIYAQAMQWVGATPGAPLDEQQRQAMAGFLGNVYGLKAPGMIIDPSGNLNQRNKLWENVGKTIAIGGGIAATGGALGAFGGAAAPATTVGSTATGAGAGGTAIGGAAGMSTPFFGAAAPASAGLVAPTAVAPLASSAIPGAFGAAAPAISSQGVSAGIGGGGLLGAAGKFLGSNWKDLLGAAGPVLGSQSEAKANERNALLGMSLAEEDLNQQRRRDLWDQLLQREQEGRVGRGDAWKQLQQGEYVAGGGRPYTAPQGLMSFGFGPVATTANEQTGGRTLSDRSQTYLKEGPTSLVPTAPSEPFQLDRSLASPGAWEQIAGAAGTGATWYDAFRRWKDRNRTGKPQGTPDAQQ